MATNLTARNLRQLQAAFRAIDSDQSGQIDMDELSTVFRSYGIELGQADLEALIGEFDRNGDGFIEFDEFVELMDQHFHVDPDLLVSLFCSLSLSLSAYRTLLSLSVGIPSLSLDFLAFAWLFLLSPNLIVSLLFSLPLCVCMPLILSLSLWLIMLSLVSPDTHTLTLLIDFHDSDLSTCQRISRNGHGSQ